MSSDLREKIARALSATMDWTAGEPLPQFWYDYADAILPLVVEAQADAVEVAIDKLKSTPIVTLAGVGGAYEWLNDYAKALREGGGQ